MKDKRVAVTPASPPIAYHRVNVSKPTPLQRVQTEVSTTKTSSYTPQVQNKFTPKTKMKIKKATPSNYSQQRPFSAIILQSRLHQYGTNLRSCVSDHLVSHSGNKCVGHIRIIITSSEKADNVIPTYEWTLITIRVRVIKTSGNIRIYCTCIFCMRYEPNQ